MTAEFTPSLRPPISDALVSVVLPVFNESAVLMELCQRLRTALTACRTTFEIIFVDDGSRDGGAALLDRLARQFADVRVVHLSRNFGQQPAIHAGLARARGDAVVIMDANLHDPPEAIRQLLDAWQAGNDVIYAVPFDHMSTWKRMLRSAGSRNFVLIDARIVQLIVALGHKERCLPRLRTWVGFKQIRIPLERSLPDANRPRASLWRRIRRAKKTLFSRASAPPAAFALLGGIALAVFLGGSACAIYGKLCNDAAIAGSTSQWLTVSLFTALNALGISMLGHYLVRIDDQVRTRPLYLVDRTANFAAGENPDADSSTAERLDDDAAAQSDALDLERLDPLEIDSGWDDAYRHLLDHAQGLLELGSLVRSEADDLADRQCGAAACSDDTPDFAAAVADPASTKDGRERRTQAEDEPRVFKLPDSSQRR